MSRMMRYFILMLILFSTDLHGQDQNANFYNRSGDIIAPFDYQIKDSPVKFRKNMGQWQDEVLYRGSANGAIVAFKKNGLSYCIGREVSSSKSSIDEENNIYATDLMSLSKESSYEYLVWNMTFKSCNKNATLTNTGKQDSKTNYLTGNDPTKWVVNAPDYTSIKYHDLYDDIDLRYYFTTTLSPNQEHSKTTEGMPSLKYDFILRPGANIRDIQMTFEGIKHAELNNKGQVLITTIWGMQVEDKPYSYQIINGVRQEVDVRYELTDHNTVGFKICDDYEEGRNLIIDPLTQVWGTFMRASGFTWNNYSYDIEIDENQNMYLTGFCDDTYPTNVGASFGGGTKDAYVTKIKPDGSGIIYSTYLGGANDDITSGIAVNNISEAFVIGYTKSLDFPIANALQPGHGGGLQDAFVARLSASGASLIYSTYLGGLNDDFGNGIVVNGASEAFMTGVTISTNFPIANAYQPVHAGGTYDAFVTHLSTSGLMLIYSTYLGGIDSEQGNSIAVNSSSEAFVTGYTKSTNFPLVNPLQPILGGGSDVFITRLATDGASLVYSTYLGELGDETGHGIAVNSASEAFVTGRTSSINFPINNAWQPIHGGGTDDAFVCRLGASGTSLIYSTFLGGSNFDWGNGIALNSVSEAFVTGVTKSTDFPVPPTAFQDTYQGGLYDMYFVHLTASGDSLGCGEATYIGGDDRDYWGCAIAMDYSGTADTVVINGTSHSSDFPTTAGAYQQLKLNPGDWDQPVVTKFVTCPSCDVSSTYIQTNNACYGDSNAMITVTPAGGNGPYTYLWSPLVSTSNSASNLAAGIYLVTITDANGCTNDSNIAITEPAAISLSSVASICSGDSIFLEGAFQTIPGNYADTLASASGCDSIVATALSVQNNISTDLNISICSGDSILAGGDYQSIDGLYLDTLSAQFGCDSIVTTNLTVISTLSSNQSIDLCAGDSILLAGAYQTIGGNYIDTLPAISGCDSIVNTALSFIAPSSVNQNFSICTGDSMFVGGIYQSGPGIYYDTLVASTDCDSIIITTLDVVSEILNNTNIEICMGDSVYLGGNFQTTSGNYFDTLSATGSCDSIIITDLSIMPAITNGLFEEICEGDSIFAGGEFQSISGIYSDTLTAASGCDSIVVTEVTTNPIPVVTAWPDTTISQGGFVQLNSTGGASCEWIPSTGLNTSTSCTPIASPGQTITYVVEVTENGCKGMDTVTIVVEGLSFTLYIPNSFTPTSDNRNDLFEIKGSGLDKFHIQIFDRWGEMIYESNVLANSWDGMVRRNKLAQEDVYVYLCKVTDNLGGNHMYVGNVTLLR